MIRGSKPRVGLRTGSYSAAAPHQLLRLVHPVMLLYNATVRAFPAAMHTQGRSIFLSSSTVQMTAIEAERSAKAGRAARVLSSVCI